MHLNAGNVAQDECVVVRVATGGLEPQQEKKAQMEGPLEQGVERGGSAAVEDEVKCVDACSPVKDTCTSVKDYDGVAKQGAGMVGEGFDGGVVELAGPKASRLRRAEAASEGLVPRVDPAPHASVSESVPIVLDTKREETGGGCVEAEGCDAKAMAKCSMRDANNSGAWCDAPPPDGAVPQVSGTDARPETGTRTSAHRLKLVGSAAFQERLTQLKRASGRLVEPLNESEALKRVSGSLVEPMPSEAQGMQGRAQLDAMDADSDDEASILDESQSPVTHPAVHLSQRSGKQPSQCDASLTRTRASTSSYKQVLDKIKHLNALFDAASSPLSDALAPPAARGGLDTETGCHVRKARPSHAHEDAQREAELLLCATHRVNQPHAAADAREVGVMKENQAAFIGVCACLDAHACPSLYSTCILDYTFVHMCTHLYAEVCKRYSERHTSMTHAGMHRSRVASSPHRTKEDGELKGGESVRMSLHESAAAAKGAGGRESSILSSPLSFLGKSVSKLFTQTAEAAAVEVSQGGYLNLSSTCTGHTARGNGHSDADAGNMREEHGERARGRHVVGGEGGGEMPALAGRASGFNMSSGVDCSSETQFSLVCTESTAAYEDREVASGDVAQGKTLLGRRGRDAGCGIGKWQEDYDNLESVRLLRATRYVGLVQML